MTDVLCNFVPLGRHGDEPAGPPETPPLAQEASAVAATIEIVSADSLGEDPPPRRWHVDGLIPAREITMLSGDGGTGKSLLALQLAVATVAERPWCGLRPERGRALYVSAEDDRDELHRRLAAIARHYGVPLSDLARLDLVPLAGRDALLAMSTGREGTLTETPLFVALRLKVEQIRPALIVFDTLADVFGGDEIKRAHARRFIGMLRGLAIDFDATVLLLAHPSLSGLNSGAGTSGSTAWSNSVRSRLYFKHEGDEAETDLRVLTSMKSNYGPRGRNIRMYWQDGVFVLPNGGGTMIGQDSADERRFLDLLEEFAKSGRTASSGRGRNYAPTLFSQAAGAKGVSFKRFQSAMERLFARREIHAKRTGPTSRSVESLTPGPPP